jgi:LruC domain-containing protein
MKKFNLIAAAAVMFLASCKKEDASSTQNPASSISSFSEIKAPQGFDFSATKSLSITLKMPGSTNNSASTIEIFDSNPFGGGELIYKGFTNSNSLTADLTVNSALKQVFVVKTEPNGNSTTQVLPVTGKKLNHTFGTKAISKKTVIVSTNCNTGCDQSYNNKSGNFNINSNDPAGVYCFTGNTTASINVNRGGVTIRLCGTADMQNLNLNQGAKLEIVDGANVTIKNLGANSGSEVTNYNATLTIENNFSPNGPVTNHGIIIIDKSLNINNGSGLTNNGTITVDDHLNNNDDLINNGAITVDGHCNLNGGSTTTNNCKLIVGQELRVNNNTKNYGYIEAGQDVKINGGSDLNLYDGAMVYGKQGAHINAMVDGISNTSVVKFDGNTTINGGAGISGNLELCVGGSFTNNGNINSPAALACGNTFIATSGCNPTGNGSAPQVADADNDNVPDNTDLFPNDPERAGEVYYPSANTFSTLAFEDLWPAMGDYDFNDLVLDYRIHWVTDADNKAKDVVIEYKVRAIGAGYRNGFGVEINVAPALVETITRTTALSNQISVNSNGTEAGQSKAVIIFFENANDELPNVGGAFVNTIPGGPFSTPAVSQVSVTFTTAQTLGNIMNMNPFMIVNQDRGREIHLSGYAPTDLANMNLFGTSSDESDPANNIYYVNKNNLPWAINLPVSFDYPSEKVDIVSGYNNFAAWALSGGASNTDWYMNTSGYRNSAKLY